MADNTLTQSRLKELLHYDPVTGVFTWLVARGSVAAGSVAGNLGGHGYWRIGIDGESYLAQRLAFLYVTGEWPPDEIDHRSLIRDDNRWNNLRPATHGQNQRNTKPYGRSRFKGVSWHKLVGKWVAEASLDCKKHYLGCYDTEEAAAAAYAAFAMKHFPDFMRMT